MENVPPPTGAIKRPKLNSDVATSEEISSHTDSTKQFSREIWDMILKYMTSDPGSNVLPQLCALRYSSFLHNRITALIFGTSLIRLGRQSRGELFTERPYLKRFLQAPLLKAIRHLGVTFPAADLDERLSERAQYPFQCLLSEIDSKFIRTFVFTRFSALTEVAYDNFVLEIKKMPNLTKLHIPAPANWDAKRSWYVDLDACARYSDGRVLWYQSGGDLGLVTYFLNKVNGRAAPQSLTIIGTKTSTRTDFKIFFNATKLTKPAKLITITLDLSNIARYIKLPILNGLEIWNCESVTRVLVGMKKDIEIQSFHWRTTDRNIKKLDAKEESAVVAFLQRLPRLQHLCFHSFHDCVHIRDSISSSIPSELKSLSVILNELHHPRDALTTPAAEWAHRFNDLVALHLAMPAATQVLVDEHWDNNARYVQSIEELADHYQACTSLKQVAISATTSAAKPPSARAMADMSLYLAQAIANSFNDVDINLETVFIHWRNQKLGAGEKMPDALSYAITWPPEKKRLGVQRPRAVYVPGREADGQKAAGMSSLGLNNEYMIHDFIKVDFPLLPSNGTLREHWESLHGVSFSSYAGELE